MGFSTPKNYTLSCAKKLPHTSGPGGVSNAASPSPVGIPVSADEFESGPTAQMSRAANPVSGNKNVLRNTSLSVKRAASGSVSSNSSTEHKLRNGSPSKHIKKKHKYHDLGAKARVVIGTYKGVEHLPVYAKEHQDGEVRIHVHRTSDLPFRLVEEYNRLAETTQDIGIDLNDVVLHKDIFPGYRAIDFTTLAKNKRLQLIKNYLQSKNAARSRTSSNISADLEQEEVRVVSSAASDTVDTSVDANDAVEKQPGGDAPTEATSTPATPVTPAMPAYQRAVLYIGNHKKDRNIPVLAYLRRDPNPEAKTILFRVSHEQAKKSKFSFPHLAIKDEYLLQDVALIPEFALGSIEDIKSAIICHFDSTPQTPVLYSPTQRRPASQQSRFHQEPSVAQDAVFVSETHAVSIQVSEAAGGCDTSFIASPVDSNIFEAQQNATPVVSDTDVVAAPQQVSSKLSPLCGILKNLDHAVIAIKAAIDSEAKVASREKNEKSAWESKRKLEENSFEQRKQELDQEIARCKQEHQQLVEQTRQKCTQVLSLEEAVKTKQSKVEVDERSVNERKELLARQEAEANAWEERLRKDERRIDIKAKSIRIENEARNSRQNSLNELDPSKTSDPSILISQSSLSIANTSNPHPIKKLELSGGKSFEKLFSQAGKGVPNAGTYYERKPRTVKFMPDPTIGQEDYLAVRTLQPLNLANYTIENDSLVLRIPPEVLFVEGTKEKDVLQAGSHTYTVFKEFGVSKYLDNRPELVSHEGKLYICWYLYKKFMPW